MTARDTPTMLIHEAISQDAMSAAMANQSEVISASGSQIEREGDFFRFPKLPLSIRQRIWKHSFPSGRVVDVVFDQKRDRYFSFRAVVPSTLHVSKESRVVGLQLYTLCFGTESYSASIPFDFKVDCLFFHDWLAPRTKAGSGSPPTCASELARIIGSMGTVEMQGIHRIAISIDFFTSFSYEQFVAALQVLCTKFPDLDYLVFTAEQQDPYSLGQIYFEDLVEDDFCCHDCYFHTKTKLLEAMNAAFRPHNKESGSEGKRSSGIQLRLRRVFKVESSFRDIWVCSRGDDEKDREEEYLPPSLEENAADPKHKHGLLSFRPAYLEDIASGLSEEEKEESDDNLEEGELEGLLQEGLLAYSFPHSRRQNSERKY